MLDICVTDNVEYIQGLTGDANDLTGVKRVQKADTDIPTVMQPAITVEWDGKLKTKWTSQYWEVRGRLGIMLYLTSMKGPAAADAALQFLTLRFDPVLGRYAGLLPALVRRTSWESPINGQNYYGKLLEDVKTGRLISETKHYTLGLACEWEVWTMLDRTQIGLFI